MKLSRLNSAPLTQPSTSACFWQGKLPPRAEAPARPALTEAQIGRQFRQMQALDRMRALPKTQLVAKCRAIASEEVARQARSSKSVAQGQAEVAHGREADSENSLSSHSKGNLNARPVYRSSLAQLRDIASNPSAPQHIRNEAQRVLDEATRPALTLPARAGARQARRSLRRWRRIGVQRGRGLRLGASVTRSRRTASARAAGAGRDEPPLWQP